MRHCDTRRSAARRRWATPNRCAAPRCSRRSSPAHHRRVHRIAPVRCAAAGDGVGRIGVAGQCQHRHGHARPARRRIRRAIVAAARAPSAQADDRRDRRDPVRHHASQPRRHPAAPRQPGRIDASRVDTTLARQSVDQPHQVGDIVAVARCRQRAGDQRHTGDVPSPPLARGDAAVGGDQHEAVPIRGCDQPAVAERRCARTRAAVEEKQQRSRPLPCRHVHRDAGPEFARGR